MTRPGVIGLPLVVCSWWLGIAGCSMSDQPVAKSGQEPAGAQAQDASVAPVGPPPGTLPEQLLWLWQRDIDQYRRHTKDPESLRPQAEDFMRTVQGGMLPQPRGPRWSETAEIGKRLLEQGCQDPILKAYYGKAVCRDGRSFDALPLLAESLNAWSGSGYPGELRRMSVFTLFSEGKLYASAMDWPRLRRETAWLVAERVRDGTIDSELRRAVFWELRSLQGDSRLRDCEDAVVVHEAGSKEPKADPWIVHMLAANAYLSTGWHHRGGEWAHKVTPEGWRLFGENLQKAAGELGEAMKLHPECPEAAAQMITVAMAGESEKTPQAWFDAAVAAQFDYMPAYDRLRGALLPRWGGSHEAMYEFGCRCADTHRYDTMVPFVLLHVLDKIDEELGYNCQAWRREGVYARVKEVLEGMASDPARADGTGLQPTQSSVKTLFVALAARAGEYQEARRYADEVGDRFDRGIFGLWCSHPELELASIYAFTGKGADHITKAWQILEEAPRPCPDHVLVTVKDLFQEALDDDGNQRSRAYCQARVADMEGRLAYSAGKWFEKKFDRPLVCWLMPEGVWAQENENSAVGHPRGESGRVLVRPYFVPLLPLEIEFDVGADAPITSAMTLGLFIPESGQTGVGKKEYHQFFVRLGDNQAGMVIAGQSESVPCPLKEVNRLRVQLADGRAVLFVNDTLCLDRNEEEFYPEPVFEFGCNDHLYPFVSVRVSNVRIRKWDPPAKKAAPKKEEASPGDSKPGDSKRGRI